jgi:HPr kinase/phosphorylase
MNMDSNQHFADLYKPIPRKAHITVAHLVEELKQKIQLRLEACGAGNLEKKLVTEAELHRPGLALAGFTDLFTWQRIQVIGNTETNYLAMLSPDDRLMAVERITSYDIPVIFVTSGNHACEELVLATCRKNIPMFETQTETTRFMFLLRDFLEDQFAVQTMVHGSMVDVYGIGMLIHGKSGIGKSEVALDLVERGHRLVADDVVILTKKNNTLMASATELTKHFMEIRGLGLIDIMAMFGIRSIRYQKRLEVLIELSLWDESHHIDRIGLDKKTVPILDVNIPIVHLPITPGKNITVIAEVIAMNHLTTHYGYDAAKAFQQKLNERIKNKKPGIELPQRAVEYFEGDYE